MAISNNWTPKLGLDLQGGTTITLTAQNTDGTGQIDPNSLAAGPDDHPVPRRQPRRRRDRGDDLRRPPDHRQRAQRPAGRARPPRRADRRAAVPRGVRRRGGHSAADRLADPGTVRGGVASAHHRAVRRRHPVPAAQRQSERRPPTGPAAADRPAAADHAASPPRPGRAPRRTRPSTGSRPRPTRRTSPRSPVIRRTPTQTSPTSPWSPATRTRPRSTCSAPR